MFEGRELVVNGRHDGCWLGVVGIAAFYTTPDAVVMRGVANGRQQSIDQWTGSRGDRKSPESTRAIDGRQRAQTGRESARGRRSAVSKSPSLYRRRLLV